MMICDKCESRSGKNGAVDHFHINLKADGFFRGSGFPFLDMQYDLCEGCAAKLKEQILAYMIRSSE
jgi:hypothetical protein